MVIYYRLILYLFFGLLPSLAWLFYYLRKDLHPEPKRIIIRTFLYGILITIPVFLAQVGLSDILKHFQQIALFATFPILLPIIKWFIIIALTEELLKYAVVKLTLIHSPELDEPLDIMLYMVVVALGFSAMENMLYLFSPLETTSAIATLQSVATISLIRFVGATFLHTLCSALFGYFLAVASVKPRKKVRLFILGLVWATLLHGLYDFSIMTLGRPVNFIIPLVIIIALACFMVYDFDEIKKLKGICKIQ